MKQASPPATGKPESTFRSRQFWQLAVICGTQFLVALDYSIINVAAPSIRRSMDFSSGGGVAWVLSAYPLAFCGFLLLGGRIADLYGRKRVFIWSLAGFLLASLLAGLAWSPATLIAGRALQGVAAAFIAPAGLGLPRRPSRKDRHANVLSASTGRHCQRGSCPAWFSGAYSPSMSAGGPSS